MAVKLKRKKDLTSRSSSGMSDSTSGLRYVMVDCSCLVLDGGVTGVADPMLVGCFPGLGKW